MTKLEFGKDIANSLPNHCEGMFEGVVQGFIQSRTVTVVTATILEICTYFNGDFKQNKKKRITNTKCGFQ